MSDLIQMLEDALVEAASNVDLEAALEVALQADPVRTIEAICKLRELHGKGLEGLGDSQLEAMLEEGGDA